MNHRHQFVGFSIELVSPDGVTPSNKINKVDWQPSLSSPIEPKGLFPAVANRPRLSGSLTAVWCGDICALTFREGDLEIAIYTGTSRQELFDALAELLKNGIALRAA